MAQVAANRIQSTGACIDYTPSGSSVTAGDVVVVGNVVGVATSDIADGELGSLAMEGVFEVPKSTAAIAVGVLVYWGPTGDPVGGTAGSGAATSTAGSLKQMGYAIEAAGSGVATVKVRLSVA